MAKLLYMTITSLDGFIEDSEGDFGWGVPSPELHQFFNDLQRPIGTHLYGRRLYETMAVWETMKLDESLAGLEEEAIDYQKLWRAAEKIVYSTTLQETWTARTKLENVFDVDAVRALKESAETDLVIGGAALASSAFAAGLIDEVHQTISPVILGAGKPAYSAQLTIDLELLDHRRFESGAVHLHYKVKQRRELGAITTAEELPTN
ncbi:MAG: dihydrofolate reductase family protein [Thermoleophilaceae bacterium]|nr:dihydrofolate reductase family protein [Thermoleophilaceae bacterium]